MKKFSAPLRELSSSFIHRLGLFSSISVLSACGELPGFTVDAKTDSFSQLAVTNDKIDILFVVDNSGSMQNEQDNLAQSFENFINQFVSKDLNFQVGVISTDVVNNSAYWAATGTYSTSSPYKNFSNAGPGTLLAKSGNEKILKKDTTNLIDKFQQNVGLGTSGNGAEAGVLSVIKFFNPALLAEGGWNNGFVREGALLAVIFVSDEDESWGIAGTSGVSTTTYIRTLTGGQKNARLEELKTIVLSAKNNSQDLVRVDAIVAPTVAECPSVGSTGGVSGTGEVYKEAVQALGGTGSVINICQDFSDELSEIGTGLVTMLSRFKLIQKPLGQIEVRVDGVLIERNAVNGWEYLPETQEVEFRGSAIPNANASIDVKYVPGAPLE